MTTREACIIRDCRMNRWRTQYARVYATSAAPLGGPSMETAASIEACHRGAPEIQRALACILKSAHYRAAHSKLSEPSQDGRPRACEVRPRWMDSAYLNFLPPLLAARRRGAA